MKFWDLQIFGNSTIFQLNGVESLCRPACARDSKMAVVALELLNSGRGADMLFEIVQNTTGEASDSQTN